jgi:arylsulfatase A-like enzyme
MNTLCLIVDRFHTGYVGAYGNAWIETPSLNRLAAESLVLDQALIDSPQLDPLYHAYWQGLHALCPATHESRPSLAALLRNSGIATTLLTDEPQVAHHPAAEDFEELIELDSPQPSQLAEEIEQTHFAQCFAQIIDRLESATKPFLLWSHLGGLGTTWDAPLTFRRNYAEPGDPDPPASPDVPNRMLAKDYDPDEWLGISQSYAGQITLFDACLGVLLDYLADSPIGRETQLVLLGARGFPLGEHHRVGPCDEALYGELVHVPWMIRFPNGDAAAARSQSLVEPTDLWATLLDGFGIRDVPPSPTAASLLPLVRREVQVIHDRLCILGNDGRRAIRTPAWYLRNSEAPELFAKPDDRWEVNNVASRCPEVVENLREVLAQYEQAVLSGRIADLPALSDVWNSF